MAVDFHNSLVHMMRLKLEHWINRQWYLHGKICHLFAPLSFLYKKVTNAGEIPLSQKLPTPVWVVGNLTVGGSGKTPFIIAMARLAAERGLRVLVVTKPYRIKHKLSKTTFIESALEPKVFGDEPCLIKAQTKADVLCIAKSRQDIKKYTKHYDLILCDDGLQDHTLQRSVNWVVVNNQRGFGNGHLIPRGPMRTALKWSNRIDHVVERGKSQESALGYTLTVDLIYALDTNNPCDIAILKNKNILIACGLGHPDGFFDEVLKLGIQGETMAYPDHHVFSKADINYFRSFDAVIISEKDAVKVKSFNLSHVYVTKTNIHSNNNLSNLVMDLLNAITESDTIMA